jgi:protein XagA
MGMLRYRYIVRVAALAALIAAGRPCAAAHAQIQPSPNELRMFVAETISERKQEAIRSALKAQEVMRPTVVKPVPALAVAQKPPAPPAKKETPPVAEQTSDTENAPPVSKGAWTIPKGKLYCELYNKYYWHSAQFDSNGHKVGWDYNGEYNEISSDLKLEYGLMDTTSLLLELPYKRARWKDDFADYTNRALADWWTGIKYRLALEPIVTSVQARVKIPGNYNKNHVPSMGRRQVDYEVKLLFAKGLAPFINGYSKLETGFRYRTHLPTDEIPYFLEFGYNLTRFLILKATLDGVEGIKGTGDIEEDYTKWTLGTIWKIKNYGIELGYGDTFMGKNTSAAQEVILSLSALF